jgi:hypothetical protein
MEKLPACDLNFINLCITHTHTNANVYQELVCSISNFMRESSYVNGFNISSGYGTNPFQEQKHNFLTISRSSMHINA